MPRSPAKPVTTERVFIEPIGAAPPVPGFYRVRLVKGGPWVACAVEHGPTRDPETDEPLDRSWMWSVWVDGTLRADPSPDWRAAFGDSAWALTGETIDRAEYDFMLADARWAAEHAPADPKANPTKRVNLAELELPF